MSCLLADSNSTVLDARLGPLKGRILSLDEITELVEILYRGAQAKRKSTAFDFNSRLSDMPSAVSARAIDQATSTRDWPPVDEVRRLPCFGTYKY